MRSRPEPSSSTVHCLRESHQVALPASAMLAAVVAPKMRPPCKNFAYWPSPPPGPTHPPHFKSRPLRYTRPAFATGTGMRPSLRLVPRTSQYGHAEVVARLHHVPQHHVRPVGPVRPAATPPRSALHYDTQPLAELSLCNRWLTGGQVHSCSARLSQTAQPGCTVIKPAPRCHSKGNAAAANPAASSCLRNMCFIRETTE